MTILIFCCVKAVIKKAKRSTVSRTSVFLVTPSEMESGTVWEEKMNWMVSEFISLLLQESVPERASHLFSSSESSKVLLRQDKIAWGENTLWIQLQHFKTFKPHLCFLHTIRFISNISAIMVQMTYCFSALPSSEKSKPIWMCLWLRYILQNASTYLTFIEHRN